MAAGIEGRIRRGGRLYLIDGCESVDIAGGPREAEPWQGMSVVWFMKRGSAMHLSVLSQEEMS